MVETKDGRAAVMRFLLDMFDLIFMRTGRNWPMMYISSLEMYSASQCSAIQVVAATTEMQ